MNMQSIYLFWLNVTLWLILDFAKRCNDFYMKLEKLFCSTKSELQTIITVHEKKTRKIQMRIVNFDSFQPKIPKKRGIGERG